MGIKERQERDREAVRRGILDAARELFVNEGYMNVSIRKIAERIEYSPAAVYGYFESKDDIFFALAEEGFQLLGGLPDIAEPSDPLEVLRRGFWRLYEFSKEYPQYFALMFIDRAVPRISQEYERFAFARETKARVVNQVRACVDAGVFPSSTKPFAAFRVLSMGMFGVSVMRLSGRTLSGEEADAIAHDVLETIIAGLRAGVELQAADMSCEVEPDKVLASRPA
jgi:AcrR family transcriptional regulator